MPERMCMNAATQPAAPATPDQKTRPGEKTERRDRKNEEIEGEDLEPEYHDLRHFGVRLGGQECNRSAQQDNIYRDEDILHPGPVQGRSDYA